MFPDGKHLAVGNHESSSITTFAVDYEKKLIVMKGETDEGGDAELYFDDKY